MLLFGCGNMGRAMLDGWIAGGVDPASFIVVDPMAQALPVGVAHFTDASQVGRKVSVALAAVKPQIFTQISRQLESVLTEKALVFSVMAGVRIEALESALPGRSIVRLMPNLAAALGKSPLGLFETSGDATLRADIDSLLSPLGTPVWIGDEALMDAVTALAGSGPAFVYRFIDALAKAGEALGLDPAVSATLAKSMVDGAVDLAVAADASPEELARRVTSPGGTTAAGLAIFDAGLQQLVNDTLKAARDRGVELSRPD
ncbi:MAG: pyrroline-5-carboxylate reductase [Sphingomonadales bacterium]|nr:pyrroline-5-carboxylate reductase [Sphingomonadales bacterium]MBK9004998.1 pyrroline-5-carboxylate reductase [Sphingomonadales bacterium]MBK9267269.1 pyrroline-5-carboxylate reductase [Sphingomonadales bacterium]MBP6433597.1 pyrroline-5-carboxylate reductase [Sphingorhabdus sp.]